MSLTQPSDWQSVEDMVRDARENAEPREGRQRKKKTFLHGFNFRRVFRGSEVLNCAVLRELSLTARKGLSHRALHTKLTNLGSKSGRI